MIINYIIKILLNEEKKIVMLFHLVFPKKFDFFLFHKLDIVTKKTSKSIVFTVRKKNNI
jgi:hypothetical protein